VHSAVLRLHVVRPSVCTWRWWIRNQDHIGWKSWKLIARTISPTPSLFVAQRPSTYSQGRLEVGWRKVACWITKAAISVKHEKIEEKLPWRTYRKSQTLFRTVPSPTPYGIRFLKIGGSQPHPKTAIAIPQERLKLRTANLADTFTGSIRTQAHEKIWRKGNVGASTDGPIFWLPTIISWTRKATNFKLGKYIHRVHPNKNSKKIWEKRDCGCIQGLPNFFLSTPLLSQEWVKLRTSNLVGIFTGSMRTKAP